MFPVEPVSDAPIYHLPFAWQWWKSGRLLLVPTPFGEEAAPYFPANGDLWLTWLLATGGGPLVKVGQWPFLALAAAALYALARRIDDQSLAAIVPPLLWVGLPIVLAQSNIANIDLIWSTFLFVAVSSCCVGSRGPIVPVGVCCGGSRCRADRDPYQLVGALFVLPLLLLAVVVAVRRAAPLRQLGWLSCGVLLPCGFWYARNVWLTGNPIYPMQISAFGHVIAAGWFDRSRWWRRPIIVRRPGGDSSSNRLVLVSGLGGLAHWRRRRDLGIGWRAGSNAGRRCMQGIGVVFETLALAQAALYWFVLPSEHRNGSCRRRWAWRWCLSQVWRRGRREIGKHRGTGRSSGIVQAVLFALAGWQVLGRLSFSFSLPLAIIAAGAALRWMPRARWLTASARSSWWAAVSSSGRRCAHSMNSRFQRFYPGAGFAARLLPRDGRSSSDRSRPRAPESSRRGNKPALLSLRVGHRSDVEYVNIDDHPDSLPHDYHRERLRRGGTELAANPWPQWSPVDRRLRRVDRESPAPRHSFRVHRSRESPWTARGVNSGTLPAFVQ